MLVLSVDLAAKYSAVCVMDDQYQVVEEFDSFDISEHEFVSRLMQAWKAYEPDVMVVEDLPHGLSYTNLVKTVIRIQGRIVERMQQSCIDYCGGDGDLDRLIFLAPATWRAHYQGMQRGTGPGVVVPVSMSFGYHPPKDDIRERAKGRGGKSRAEKVITDYCSAYLIARWAVDTHAEYKSFDVPGTARYGQKPILKKDFHVENR